MSDSSVFKLCNRCRVVKPATREFFYAHKSCKYGLTSHCKTCNKEKIEAKKPLAYHTTEAFQDELKHPQTLTDMLGVRKIPMQGVNRGKFALVDEADFFTLMLWAWGVCRCGYARRGNKGKIMWMSHAVMGDTQGLCVDHINGDRLDNRRCNLRLATYGQNNAGKRLVKRRSKSGFRGVYLITRSKKFSAQIRYGNVTHYLGSFVTPEAAARAYDAEATRVWGEFARLNFPVG